MALSRIQSEFTYTSGVPGSLYTFTILVDSQNNIAVRNILTPQGILQDPYTQLPLSVTSDIQTAIGQVENIVGQTSATNGLLTFTGQSSLSVTFPTAFSSTGYRVSLDVPDFIPHMVVSKLTTGFTVQLAVPFTGTVGYDVFV